MSEVARNEEPVLSEGQLVDLSVLVDAVGSAAVIAALSTLPQDAERLGETRSAVATATTVATDPEGSESAETDLRLARYKEQWDKLPAENKGSSTWEKLRERILDNTPKGSERKTIDLAQEMAGGGQLIGVDTDGGPLFADVGEDPRVFGAQWCGKNYPTTRTMVREKGYELFPVTGDNNKGREMKLYEAATNQPFVRSTDGKFVSSWAESGPHPALARLVGFVPFSQEEVVSYSLPRSTLPDRGARRLLRGR